MAVTVTAADLDALSSKYFVREDGTDWNAGTDIDSAPALGVLSSELPGGYKARIGSLSQDVQDDLVAQMDPGVNALRP
jgi:hypothetical protein